ncbi:MAG: hypothetical protein HDR03_08665 [Lachnospiraceae bacterium]|nr:hypothetical protein [Lachnospiraceae bacterium]
MERGKDGALMGYLTSGNPIVDAMGTLNITGNIVPTIWYKTVQKENGKPYLLAIAILSDVVYWYRPTEVRDQSTGQVLGWKKRFSEDILRQSYQYYADLFGESKKTVKTAIDRLEELEVIKRYFRIVSYGDGLVSNNVMYLELIPAKLYELTYPDEEPGMDKKKKPCPAGTGDKTGGSLPTKPDTPMENFGGRGIQNGIQVLQDFDTGVSQNVHTLYPKRDTPVSQNGGTNTENTQENTIRDYSYHINPSQQSENGNGGIDRIDVIDRADSESVLSEYIEQIKENIEYDDFMSNNDYHDRELYHELYEIIYEIVCIKHDAVRIGGEVYPYELVKARFLALNSSHLQYVIDCMQNTTVKITNVKAYMITTLFNAPATMKHYYQQEVNHDMYGGGWQDKGIT